MASHQGSPKHLEGQGQRKADLVAPNYGGLQNKDIFCNKCYLLLHYAHSYK